MCSSRILRYCFCLCMFASLASSASGEDRERSADENSNAANNLSKGDGDDGWVASKDGILSLRLTSMKETVGLLESSYFVVELRNDSKKVVNVIRPFGDQPVAFHDWLEIRAPDHRLRCTMVSGFYMLHSGMFATLKPGQELKEKRSWSKVVYDEGADLPVKYQIRFTYAPQVGYSKTATEYGFKDMWTGVIATQPIYVTRKKS